MKITTETGETMEFNGTVDELKEKLGIAEWPQMGDTYWSVNDRGYDVCNSWQDTPADHHCQSLGNCSPTPEGLAQYKAVMAKVKALWAIEQHRDKTFGVFEPDYGENRYYGSYWNGKWSSESRLATWASIHVPFAKRADIERSFAECGEHWEVLK